MAVHSSSTPAAALPPARKMDFLRLWAMVEKVGSSD